METFIIGLRYFFIDFIGGIMRWPLWWYTHGLIFVFNGGKSWIFNYSKTLGLKIWVKNLFVPMYGMRDWQSRIISFFMRLFQIIFRMIGILVLSLMTLLVLILYIVAPPLTIMALFYQVIELYG